MTDRGTQPSPTAKNLSNWHWNFQLLFLHSICKLTIHFQGHYLFHHPHHYEHDINRTVLSHTEHINNLTKSILPDHWSTSALDTEEWDKIKQSIHTQLNAHPDVLQYNQQVVRQRSVD